jgi:hypothetical protein
VEFTFALEFTFSSQLTIYGKMAVHKSADSHFPAIYNYE